MRTLQQMCRDAGYEALDYSGANMYGEKCLAVAFGGDTGRLVSDMIDALVMRGEPDDIGPELATLSKAFRGMKLDAFGKTAVAYFPSVLFEEGDNGNS